MRNEMWEREGKKKRQSNVQYKFNNRSRVKYPRLRLTGEGKEYIYIHPYIHNPQFLFSPSHISTAVEERHPCLPPVPTHMRVSNAFNPTQKRNNSPEYISYAYTPRPSQIETLRHHLPTIHHLRLPLPPS